MKSRLLNLLLVLVTLLAGLGALEAFLRLVPSTITLADLAHFKDAGLRAQIAGARGLPTRDGSIRLARPEGGPEVILPTGTLIKPVDPVDAARGAIELDIRPGGFCNDSPPRQIEPALVAVGDSFTHCTAVAPNDAWPHLLGVRRGEVALDLGMPGQGLYEYRDALREFADRPGVETVVVAFYEGNDIRDGLQYLRAIRNGKTGAASSASGALEAENPLLGSYALNTIVAKVEVLWSLYGWRNVEDFRYRVTTQEGPVAMNAANADQNEIDYARHYAEGELDEAKVRGTFEPPMRDIADWAGQRDIDLLFVYIPSAHSAYGEATTFSDPEVGKLVSRFSAVQRAIVADICAANGLACLDLTPLFNARLPEAPLAYFPANLHLTPAGHALVAELVGDRLAGR